MTYIRWSRGGTPFEVLIMRAAYALIWLLAAWSLCMAVPFLARGWPELIWIRA
jgi:hypothetical protein